MDSFDKYRNSESVLSLITLSRDNAINNELLTKLYSQLDQQIKSILEVETLLIKISQELTSYTKLIDKRVKLLEQLKGINDRRIM